jgi:hypothetical protein
MSIFIRAFIKLHILGSLQNISQMFMHIQSMIIHRLKIRRNFYIQVVRRVAGLPIVFWITRVGNFNTYMMVALATEFLRGAHSEI